MQQVEEIEQEQERFCDRCEKLTMHFVAPSGTKGTCLTCGFENKYNWND